MPQVNRKRPAPSVRKASSKKRKVSVEPKSKGKAAHRETIPIPAVDDQDNENLSDQDLEIVRTYGGGVTFLQHLDHKGIARSKKETERLHKLDKPVQKISLSNDFPSIGDQESDWNTDLEDLPSSSSDESTSIDDAPLNDCTSDTEMSYERRPRHGHSWDFDRNGVLKRLPIKLADGRIEQTGVREVLTKQAEGELEKSSISHDVEDMPKLEDVSTGARFGRPAVVDVIGNNSRRDRIQDAKEQIAGICQEILSDPENSLGLLRRLHTFSLKEVSSLSHPEPIPNDPIIRQLALLSQLAVFKDIIPGYRIRQLTDKEKAEKVSQLVARNREWEQGLVLAYQNYLRSLEVELKAESPLADAALQCICALAVEATHFNFRTNLMSCIVAQLSKKLWSQSSVLCLNTIIKVFQADLTGVPSLEIVKFLNQMIKKKRFNIDPEVLSCLLHLRLKTELAVQDSQSIKKSSTRQSKGKETARRSKGKPTSQPHMSKRLKKALKEKKEIEREFREAEAEVDKEERSATHTETLKLLFVLYFRILKNPHPTPLLPAALKGIAKYAHLVNIDFFKDLMKVLKDLITRSGEDEKGDDDNGPILFKDARAIQHRLQCIVTAFELLSGQGEALNIDLSDFISNLYTTVLPLSIMANIETYTPSHTRGARVAAPETVTNQLFRALNIIFSPQTLGTASPSWRSAAFAKRLLAASLYWPPPVVLRALEFVGGLLAKDAKLEALLSTEDRTFNGIYRPDIDDPQLCCPFGASFWELHALRQHWDPRVREEATKLMNFRRT